MADRAAGGGLRAVLLRPGRQHQPPPSLRARAEGRAWQDAARRHRSGDRRLPGLPGRPHRVLGRRRDGRTRPTQRSRLAAQAGRPAGKGPPGRGQAGRVRTTVDRRPQTTSHPASALAADDKPRYSPGMDLITSTDALAAACARLAAHPFVTVDTEFMRETTYYPKLCLIQMASAGEAVLIDPLGPGLDLTPFLDLMANEAVLKVFHSARQDLEIIWNLGRLVPHPVFDTQVAAMVCGYGDSVSYEQLVNDLAKARVDKSSRFTDWSHRPLSEAQSAYALSDVTHLVKVYDALAAELARTGRSGWLAEEMEILTSPETYRADPDNAWRRLAGRLRKAREIAVLMELAAWREREAQM